MEVKGSEKGEREKEREGSEENVHNPFILLPVLVKAVLVSFMSISLFSFSHLKRGFFFPLPKEERVKSDQLLAKHGHPMDTWTNRP